MYELYFVEYMVHKKYLKEAKDLFLKFLEVITRVFKPPSPSRRPALAEIGNTDPSLDHSYTDFYESLDDFQ